MSKLFAMVAIALLLLLTGSCEVAQQDETPMIETYRFNSIAKIANVANIGKWRRDAIAYIDKIISQSKGKSDVLSTEYEYDETVIIQSPDTLEKLKQYIRNAEHVSDTTRVSRKPSPWPTYQVGEMPKTSYEGFDFEYKNPYQLIHFRFTEFDTKEFQDYLNKIIQQ